MLVDRLSSASIFVLITVLHSNVKDEAHSQNLGNSEGPELGLKLNGVIKGNRSETCF